jgi:hypothetical protein
VIDAGKIADTLGLGFNTTDGKVPKNKGRAIADSAFIYGTID